MSERINLTPIVWGPKTWFFLDSMGMAYPENPTDAEKLSAKNLLLSLIDLLPCWGCRVNYEKYINEYTKTKSIDYIVENRTNLLAFIIDVHNDVRTKSKKPTKTVEETFKYYNIAYLNTKPEEFTSNNNKLENLNLKHTDSHQLIKSLLYQYNPIMILIGIILGLIIYKFFQDGMVLND